MTAKHLDSNKCPKSTGTGSLPKTGKLVHPAVVVNAATDYALNLIRPLGRLGIPVTAVFGLTEKRKIVQHIIRRSRYINRAEVFETEDYEAGLLDCLLRLGRSLEQKAVLFPTTDAEVRVISRCRNELAPYYFVYMPPNDTVELLLDKNRFYPHAEKLGLPVPRSFVPADLSDLDAIIDTIRFPCLIKPYWRHAGWSRAFHPLKMIITNTPAELKETYKKAIAVEKTCIVQELIRGPEENLTTTYPFLDRNSEPIAVLSCYKIRQYPPVYGETSMAVSLVDEELEQLARQICKALGLVGMIGIQIKRDSVDGSLKIVEINPSRWCRSTGILVSSGINLPEIWYRYVSTGEKIAVGNIKTGVKWISEHHEWRNIIPYWKMKDHGFIRWLKSYSNVRGFEVMSFDDPAPFFALLSRLPKHVFSRKKR